MAQYGLKNTTASSITIGSQTIPASGTLVFYDSSTHFSDFQDDIDTALETSGTLNALLASGSLQHVVDGIVKTAQNFYDFWGSYFGYTVLKSTATQPDADLNKVQTTSVFWASPAGDVHGTPTFRKIAASDIPDLSATYAKSTGQTFTGKVITVASATSSAGFNLVPGVAPSAPSNGDLWTTNSGIFAQINGATVQLNSTVLYLPLSGGVMTGKLSYAASTTSLASANFPTGATPVAPVAGDLYVNSSGLFKYYTGTSTYTLAFIDVANVWAGKQTFVASTTSASSLNVPPGTAPTSPVSGDIWNVSGALTWYNGSTSLEIAALNAANVWSASQTFNYITLANAGLTVSGAKTTLSAPASSYASLNMPSGSAPSTLASGDLWNQSGLLKFYDGGTTKTIGLLEATSSWTGVQTFAAGASITNGKLNTAASVASYASLNIPASTVAPTSPVSGDLWNLSGALTWYNGVSASPVALINVAQTWTAAPTFSAGFSVTLNEATFAVATASYASFNVPSSSVSPSSLTVGDYWTLSSVPKFYDGAVKTFALLESAQTFTGAQTFSSLVTATAGVTVTNAKTTLAVSTATISSLNIPSSTISVSTPVAGDISMYRASLMFQDGTANREIFKTLWAQTSTVTIANSTTATTLVGTIAPTSGNTLGANFFSYAGKTLEIDAAGTIYDSGATTFRMQLYFGSTIAMDSTAITIPKLNKTNETWSLRVVATCRTTGTTGTVQFNAFLTISNNTTGLSPWHLKMPSALVTLNTTTALTVDLRGTWGAANANNTISMTQFIGRG